MKKYSSVMCVLSEHGGQNGLQYGVIQNCIRYNYLFQAHNESEARLLCEQIGVAYDGEILLEIEVDDDEMPRWGGYDE